MKKKACAVIGGVLVVALIGSTASLVMSFNRLAENVESLNQAIDSLQYLNGSVRETESGAMLNARVAARRAGQVESPFDGLARSAPNVFEFRV